MSQIGVPPSASGPVPVIGDDGKVKAPVDTRMPYFNKQIINRNRKDHDIRYIYPTGITPNFNRKSLGPSGKLEFHIVGAKNEMIDWSDTYLELSCIPLTAADVPLKATDIDTWGYMVPAAAGAGYCKFLHFPGTHALFNHWVITDYAGNPKLEDIEHSDVYTQANLNGQVPEFFERDTLETSADFAASAIHFRSDFVLENSAHAGPTSSHMIPWDPNVTYAKASIPYAAAAATSANTAPVAECARMARMMIGNHTATSVNNYTTETADYKPHPARLKVFPASGFMKLSDPILGDAKFHAIGECPLKLVLNMNTADQAFYGVNATVATAGSAWAAGDPIITDYFIWQIRLVVSIYHVTDEVKNKIDNEQLTKGYPIEWPSVHHMDSNVPTQTSEWRFGFEAKKFTSIEKIMMVFREQANVTDDLTRPKLLFTNGELGTTAVTDYGVSTTDSVGLYRGASSIQWMYNGEYFPQKEMLMGPYAMREIRDMTGQFWDGDNTILPTMYNSLIDGLYQPHCGTMFCIGWPWETHPTAYKAGVNTTEKPLVVTVKFAKPRTTDLRVDIFIIAHAECEVKNGKPSEVAL